MREIVFKVRNYTTWTLLTVNFMATGYSRPSLTNQSEVVRHTRPGVAAARRGREPVSFHTLDSSTLSAGSCLLWQLLPTLPLVDCDH